MNCFRPPLFSHILLLLGPDGEMWMKETVIQGGEGEGGRRGGGIYQFRLRDTYKSSRLLISFPTQDLLHHFYSYVPPTDPSWPRLAKEWWKRIREAAKQSRMSRHLPETYTEMQTK